jgi:dynein assembly factor 6, axonemal
MGCKTPSTASCEDMIINIQLPDEQCSIEAMTLTVTKNEIDVQTPVYRLKIPLYQPVDPEKGKAEYNSEKKNLKLTLRLHRELDFINF